MNAPIVESTPPGLRWRSLLTLCIAFVVSLLPLSVALAFPDARFYGDWDNHVWLTGYYTEYFRQHHEMPSCLNSDMMIGMLYPVFYGYLLFPVLGALGWVTGLGAAWTVRLAFAVLWLMQFGTVYATGMKYTRRYFQSLTLACLVSWTVYPVTNLYNRSDFTELAASLLLVIGTCFWLLALKAERFGPRAALITAAGLAWTVCVGAHPITGLYTLGFVSVFVPLTFWTLRAPAVDMVSTVATLAILAAASALVLAPWVYALLTHMKKIHVTSVLVGYPVTFYHSDIDAFTTRFSPIPFDRRMWGGQSAGTPYLEACINFPLLVWALWLGVTRIANGAWRTDRKSLLLFATALLYFAAYSALSLGHELYRHLPSWFTIVQFGYRLVTFQNLCLLMAVVALFSVAAARRRYELALLVACLMLSATALTIKLAHAFPVLTNVPYPGAGLDQEERDALLELPHTFRGGSLLEYIYREGALYQSDPKLHVAKTLPFPVGKGADFGIAQPLIVEMEEPGYVEANLYHFPWLRVRVDGRMLDFSEMKACSRAQLAIPVPAGKHEIRSEFDPEPTWYWLRFFSLYALALWGATVAGMALSSYLTSMRARRACVSDAPATGDRRQQALAA